MFIGEHFCLLEQKITVLLYFAQRILTGDSPKQIQTDSIEQGVAKILTSGVQKTQLKSNSQ